MSVLRKAVIAGVYLAMLLPLVFTGSTMYPWHFGKTVLFQILVELMLLAGLAYWWKQKPTWARLNLVDWLVILFLASKFISALAGVDFTRSFWGDQSRAQGVFTWIHFTAFYFLLRQFFPKPSDWNKLIIYVVGIGAVSAALAWVGPYIPQIAGIIPSGNRLTGVMGNPIFFASYLITPTFLAFVGFFRGRSSFGGARTTPPYPPARGELARGQHPPTPLRGGNLRARPTDAPPSQGGGGVLSENWARYALLVIGFGSLITIFFTGTRGAFAGLAASVVAMYFLYLRYGLKKRKKLMVGIAGAFVILAGVSLFFINARSDFIASRSPRLAHLLDLDYREGAGSTRFLAWKVALQGWKEKPLLGWGPENFQILFDKYYNPEFLKYSFSETVWDKPHNYALEVATGMGALGLAVYLTLVMSALYLNWRQIGRQSDESSRLVYILLCGALVAYVAQSLFAFETSNSLLLWMTLLAFTSFLSFRAERSGAEESLKLGSKAIPSLRIATPIIVLVGVLIPLSLYANYRLFHSSVYMGRAHAAAEMPSGELWKMRVQAVLNYPVPFMWEQAIYAVKNMATLDAGGQLDRSVVMSAALKIEAALQKEINRHTDFYLPRFWLGQLYGFMGEYVDKSYYDKSNEQYHAAMPLSPGRQSLPLLIARNHLLQGNTAEAVKLLQELVAKNPDYQEPHWFLGLALVRSGDETGGLAHLERGQMFASQYLTNISFLIDLYAKRQEYQKIVTLYEMLIEGNPNNAAYHARLAAVYAELKDEEKTVYYLNRAVELDPALAAEAREFLRKNKIDINKYL